MRPLSGVSEDKRGAQAAVLHVNVAWLLVFVCNVDRSGRARKTTGLDNVWTLQQMLLFVARLNQAG